MEWPKRTRTVNWESGVLTLDGEKQFEVPELTAEIMERLAGYTLVGFHVKGYPVTDELLATFAGHKSMTNFDQFRRGGRCAHRCLFFRLFHYAKIALSAAGRQRRHPRQRPAHLARLQTGPSDTQPHRAG